ncbi:MAG TPA: hypothetical protein VMH23_09025 [Bacteroidota bacterium]|nr:hypothetical protein [Bacteroidota bacterium]
MHNAVDRRSLTRSLMLFAFASAAAFAMQGCGSSLQIASKWSDHALQVDGDLKDWSDSTLFVQKDDIRCAVMNDDEYLYVCVLSSKPRLGPQVMMRGMTVWFDPNGGDKKTYGVRFPIGGRGVNLLNRPEDEETDQRGNRLDAMQRPSVTDFEFLGPTEKDVQMVSRMQGQGVAMHLTSTPERFVYQLRIPLAYSSAHPYAIESHSGAKVGVGIETNTFQRPTGAEGGEEGQGRGEGGGGGGGRGGMTGRGGGRGGRGGGGAMMGNRSGNAQIAFSVWMKTQLAEKPH